MKKILLLLLMLFIPFLINAEELKMEWQKSIGGSGDDFFKSAIITKKGDIVAVGYSNSTDIEGLELSAENDAIIVKYDTNGNIIWKKKFGGTGADYFYSIVETSEEEYIVAGYTESSDIEDITNLGLSDGILVKYSTNGDIIWKKNFGGNKADQFKSIEILPTDEFVVVGNYSSTDIEGLENKGSSDGIIIKYDKDGNIIWKTILGGTSIEEFLDVAITIKNEYVVVGKFHSPSIDDLVNPAISFIFPNAIIVKLDENGEILWKKGYGDKDSDLYESIIATNDDEYIAFGYITPVEEHDDIVKYGQYDAVMVKYDSNGEMIYEKNWGGNKGDGFISSALMRNEKIVVVGESNSDDIIEMEKIGAYDAIIRKYDNKGNVISQKKYGGTTNELFINVFVNDNDELVAVGNFMSSDIDGMTNNGGEDALIVKYSSIYSLESVKVTNGNTTAVQQGTQGLITPKPDKGYEVDQIIIKDKDGNILDIATTKLEDGTYSFPLYTDVSVEVTFKLKVDNPKTGILNYGAILSLFMILPILVLIYICRYNQKYGL